MEEKGERSRLSGKERQREAQRIRRWLADAKRKLEVEQQKISANRHPQAALTSQQPEQPEQAVYDESSKTPKRKRRAHLVYNPKKESREEYEKRFLETWAQRKIEDAQLRQEKRQAETDEQREKRLEYIRAAQKRSRQRKRNMELNLPPQESGK